MAFQKSKYKQICTFFVPGNFESGENSINDQNQGMHGENFGPKRTKILRIFCPEKIHDGSEGWYGS